MQNKSKLLFLLLTSFGCTSANAFFNPIENFRISGFVSAGAVVTNAVDVDYFDPIFGEKISEVPTYFGAGHVPYGQDDTLGGFQFNFGLPDPKASIILQVVALGQPDNYHLTADWAYLNYRFSDFFTVKAGRILIPDLMFSEYVNIRYTFPWFRAPNELYNSATEDNFNGIGLYFTHYLTNDWLAQFNIVAGSNLFPSLNEAAGIGGELRLNNEYLTLRASISSGPLSATVQPEELTVIESLIGAPCTTLNEFFDVRNPTTSLGGQCDIYLTSDPAGLLLSAGVQGNQTLAKQLIVENSVINTFSAGYTFNWQNWTSLAEILYYTTESFIAADTVAWYASLGYTVDKVLFLFTFADTHTLLNSKREVYTTFTDYVNPFTVEIPAGFVGNPLPFGPTMTQALDNFFKLFNPAQRSYSVDVRWDIIDSVAIKGQIQWIDPKDEIGVGLFSLPPQKIVAQVGLGLDAVF